ncbi:MAG: hypothetical protein ACOC58_04580 [Chloroflexota bacterium]
MSEEEALEELRRCSGTQFDPVPVDAFYRAREEAALRALPLDGTQVSQRVAWRLR